MGMNQTIAALQKEALAEYRAGKVVKQQTPAEFRVLFVLFRSVRAGGKVYTAEPGSVDEKIFFEATRNFKHAVEHFTNGNVRIVTTTACVTDTVVGSDTNYLPHYDVASVLASLAPPGRYDSVITVYSGKWGYGGACSAFLFTGSCNNNWRKYGYAGCSIATDTDKSSVGKGYDVRIPYLLTTNYMIHEWLHQLEGYREFLTLPGGEGIIYPYTHVYYEDHRSATKEPWMLMKNYRWNNSYFNSRIRYPHIAERDRLCIYRAILACDIDYLPERRKVGMYPGFWKATPHKLFKEQKAVIADGRYLIQDAATRLFLTVNGKALCLAPTGTPWSFLNVGNGYFRICARLNGKIHFFDLTCGYDSENNSIELHEETTAVHAQSWQPIPAGEGKFRLRPMASLTRGLQITRNAALLTHHFSDLTLVRP